MPSACARSTGAARISDGEPPVGVRRDESSLRQTLAAEVLPNVQRVVWPRGDLASQETGRVASQHGKLGRAGLLDEVAVPTVRSRDAAVSLVSGPRSQLAARSRKPGSVSRREYPPSDRASSATGVGSYECDAEARVARDPGCRNRCTARRQSGQTIRSTSRLTSASSLCRRGSCGDSRVRPVSSVATAQVRKHAAPRTVFKLAAARLITEPVDGTR